MPTLYLVVTCNKICTFNVNIGYVYSLLKQGFLDVFMFIDTLLRHEAGRKAVQDVRDLKLGAELKIRSVGHHLVTLL